MMTLQRQILSVTMLLAITVTAPNVLRAQATVNSIAKQIQNLRTVPDAERPAATKQLALDIRTLPAGKDKLQLADALDHLSTEGDAGQETLQAVADTLAQALKETPIPAKKDVPPMPYHDLAKLVHYEGVTTTLDAPMYVKASEMVAAEDASVSDMSKADFTLTDLHNKKVTLSSLKGKIVLVNFWATWCPPCRTEMPNLDAIETHLGKQGVVVLSITDEEPMKVVSLINGSGYHPDVLLDGGEKVHRQYHVEGIPQTFVFDRDGKLVAHAIDMRTQRQFLLMLQKAGLDLSSLQKK